VSDEHIEKAQPDLPPPRLESVEAFAALSLTTRGPYWKLSGPLGRLRVWMDDLALNPAGPAFGVFYDDPDAVPSDETRFSLCYPLAAPAAAAVETALGPEGRRDDETGGQVTLERFPAQRVVALEYEGPAADSPRIYAHLAAWLEQERLEAQGPPLEVYLAEPGTLGKGLLHAELRQPVAL